MNRQDISKLRRNYASHLKMGFILSIALVALAFQWTITPPDYSDLVVTALDEEPDVQVVRTKFEKPPQLPPPSLQPTEKFIEEDIEFTEEPLPEVVEPSINADPADEHPDPVPVPAPTPAPKPELPPDPEPKVAPIHLAVEEMPRFVGCEELELSKNEKQACAGERLLKYIYQNINYPKLAREMGREGTVVARFIIEVDGSISQLELVKDIGAGCGAEVLQMIKEMPTWIPGKQNGRKVRVQFNLPVRFTLK